jgi:hypothetical protein
MPAAQALSPRTLFGAHLALLEEEQGDYDQATDTSGNGWCVRIARAEAEHRAFRLCRFWIQLTDRALSVLRLSIARSS